MGTNKVCFNDDNEENPADLPDVNTKLEFVDVTKYEAGSITDQSTLPNLLSDRDVAKMTKDDLLIFDRATFIGKWISLKIRQMIAGVMLFQICDIVMTGIILFLLSSKYIG